MTEPEQWAVELVKNIMRQGNCPAAALAIQAAFAEQNARLVGALEAVEAAMVRGGDGRILDTGWNITKLNEARPLIFAALKDRTHG